MDNVRAADAEALTALFNSSSDIAELDPTFRAVDVEEVLGHIMESQRCEILEKGFRMQASGSWRRMSSLGIFIFAKRRLPPM